LSAGIILAVRIIGIHGAAGAGKDTAADTLVQSHDFAKVGLADPMKRFCAELWRFSWDQLWGASEFRNAVDPRYGVSPRHVLQRLGTEWGRDCDTDVWVRYAIGVCRALLEPPPGQVAYYSSEHGLKITRDPRFNGWRGVVVPDVRYANEAQAIRDAGGIVVEVVRPGAGLKGVAGKHISESGIPSGFLDYRIVNEGTVEDLATAVATFVATAVARLS
jgi:hypothetical protein